MLQLEDIQKNASVSGLEPGQVVRIVTTEPIGDNALTVYYKTADGQLHERLLFRADEATLSLAQAGRPWAFDAPGQDFNLADDPGAGKTIMAGLLIRELLMRADIDSWITQKLMAGLETCREQEGSAAGPSNNRE